MKKVFTLLVLLATINQINAQSGGTGEDDFGSYALLIKFSKSAFPKAFNI